MLLIFDEVISGFRCSPGGAQQFYGVTPDLTTLAKILAGGYPGAALAGRADVLRVLDYRCTKTRCNRRSWRIREPTTRSPSPPRRASRRSRRSSRQTPSTAPHARRLRFATESTRLSAAEACDGAPTASSRISTSIAATKRRRRFTRARLRGRSLKGGIPLELVNKIRAGFLLHGVDIASWPGGLASAAHTDDDVARTVAAFESTFDMLAAEGAL